MLFRVLFYEFEVFWCGFGNGAGAFLLEAGHWLLQPMNFVSREAPPYLFVVFLYFGSEDVEPGDAVEQQDAEEGVFGWHE